MYEFAEPIGAPLTNEEWMRPSDFSVVMLTKVTLLSIA